MPTDKKEFKQLWRAYNKLRESSPPPDSLVKVELPHESTIDRIVAARHFNQRGYDVLLPAQPETLILVSPFRTTPSDMMMHAKGTFSFKWESSGEYVRDNQRKQFSRLRKEKK